MKPILTIDIGAGTTDVFVLDLERGEHYKAVVMSPVRRLSRSILAGRGDLIITGTIMGGGAVSKAVVQRAREDKVFMTPEAAKTLSDDLDHVQAQGIYVVSEEEALALKRNCSTTSLEFADVYYSEIKQLLKIMGVKFDFSFAAGAVQDHGVCPEGMNPLDFRHQTIKKGIEANPSPESLLFAYSEIPPFLTRMRATAELLSQLPVEKLYMMDTGMAAIVGASSDRQARMHKESIVADIGNSHILAAVLRDGFLGGFFEYHTDTIRPQRMQELLINLGNGDLRHEEVVAEGGHGAYIRDVPGFDAIQIVVVTGPRRHEIMDSISLPYLEGAPFGDNMMTGTVGLLECIARRESLELKPVL